MKIFKAALLLGFVLSYGAQSMEQDNAIVVYDVFPEKARTMTLDPKHFLFKGPLDRVIDLCVKGEEPWGKVYSVTATEARENFYPYLEERVGKQEAERLAPLLFSSTYFEVIQSPTCDTNPKDDAQKDPYLFNDVCNILIYSTTPNHSLREPIDRLENSFRYSLKTAFLTPQNVFEGFVANSFYKERFSSTLGTTDFEVLKTIRPSLVEGLFCERLMGIPSSPEERARHFLSKPIGFLTQDLIGRIYEVAQRMMKSSKPGDNFVIFGNTPYFVGRALKKIISDTPGDDHYRHVIEFPFSGSPNQTRDIPDAKNIVTFKRLEHLKRRMVAAGLTSANADIGTYSTHFVDVVGAASGPAYVIEEIIRDFRIASQPVPQIDIFSLNEIRVDDQDSRNKFIANENAKDGESVRLYFPNKHESHFSIMTQIFLLKGHSQLDHLPSSEWRVFPEYNAAYWLDEYNWMLTQETPYHTKVLFDYFDLNLSTFIEKDKQGSTLSQVPSTVSK